MVLQMIQSGKEGRVRLSIVGCGGHPSIRSIESDQKKVVYVRGVRARRTRTLKLVLTGVGKRDMSRIAGQRTNRLKRELPSTTP